MKVLCWGLLLLVATSLAALSTFSFPGKFLCAGIQKKVNERRDREKVLSWIFFIISFVVQQFFIARIEL